MDVQLSMNHAIPQTNKKMNSDTVVIQTVNSSYDKQKKEAEQLI